MKTQPNPLATSPPTFDLQGHISVECELSLLKDSSIIVRTGDDDSQCRICFEGDTSDESSGTLITPCNCKGSLKYIHEECLKKQIIANSVHLEKDHHCELCLEKYRVKISEIDDFSFKNILLIERKSILLIISVLVILAALTYSAYSIFENIFSKDSKDGKTPQSYRKLRIQSGILTWLGMLIILFSASLVAMVKHILTVTYTRWEFF